MNPCLNLYRTIILSVFPGLGLDETIQNHKDEYMFSKMPTFGESGEVWDEEQYIDILKNEYDNVDIIFIDSTEETRRMVRRNLFKFYVVMPDHRIYKWYSKRVPDMSREEFLKRVKEIRMRKGIASGYRIWRLGKKQDLNSVFYDIIRFDTNKFLESKSKFKYHI